ncbi:MAG: cell division protein ZapA [Oscillospiraceae bacterium]|jgi:cell division protein ZapA|nr:cell division protein ZapA [Oscillospiraceae bacterium]
MANKITLSIAGFNLIVNTTEDENRVRKLNQILNEDLSQILQSNPSASITNAALLCSLDYLDRYDKATQSANNLRTQIKDYLSDASNAKLMYDDESKKNAELVKEIQTLRAHVTKLAADGASGSANEEALRRDLDSARSDAEIIRRQLKEQLDQNRTLIDRTSSLSDRVTKLDAENQRLNSLLQTASKKLEELVNLPKPIHTDDDYDALQKKYEDLEERNVQLEIEVEDLTQKNEALASETRNSYEPLSTYSNDPVIQDTYSVNDDVTETEPASGFDTNLYSSDSQLYSDDFVSDYSDDKDTFLFDDNDIQTGSSYSLAPENEADDNDLGVEKGFKTFTQLMDEDRKERDYQQKKNFSDNDNDDDDLPNLSWINDI